MYKLFLFISLVISFYSSAEPGPVFRNITRSSGLPVDEVSTIAQDSSGFIWIGTNEGLFRYDGFTFKNFSFEGSASRVGTTITRIIVDHTGKLWITSVDGGIACITNRGQVLRVFNTFTNPLINERGNYATDVKEDKSGNIWWTTTDGLFCLSAGGTALTCYRINSPVTRRNSFSQLFFDNAGTLWVSGYLGLFTFNQQKKELQRAGSNPAERSFFASRKDFAATAVHNNFIWFSNWGPELGNFNRATGNGQMLYSGKGSTQPDFNHMANTFFIDSRGALWIGTGSGLFRGQKDMAALDSFFHDPKDNYSLANNWIKAILEDREGNFWFATRKGISVARPYTTSIFNLSTSPPGKFPLAGKIVNDIINADNNSILIGTHNADGLYLTDLNFRTQQHWNFNNVRYDWIWDSFNDKPRDRIFISTQEGMLIYNKRTRSVEKAKDTVLQNFFPVTSFVSTSDSIVWMSKYWNKIMKYNLVTGHYKIFDITLMGEKTQVLFLSKDRSNNLWILGHESGLWRFDEKTERIVERIEYNQNGTSLREPAIFFMEDLGQYLLIGYYTHGISLYDKKTKTFRHLTKENGLASNSMRDAVVSRDGKVWIATRNGLIQFDPATTAFKNYTYDNGILDNDFVCIAELTDGRIAAGSTTGLVSFHPRDVDTQALLAPPVITDFTVYGKTVPENSTNQFTIGYSDNYFAFEYISLHYSSPQQVEYAYMLKGLDKDWIPAGTRRFVSYNRVPGGHYSFRVRARLPNGQWVESNTPVKLFVQTAFYRQWWFYLLCALVVVAILYALFRYRLQQALKVEWLRAAISSDLHDEVGASLTSISLFSEMARQSAIPANKKEEYLQRIGERSRESIAQMSDIIWSINPEHDSLPQLLIRMKKYTTDLTEARNIELQWIQSGNFSAIKLGMDRRKNFYLFFKEAVNNAVKHAGAKNIEVSVHVKGQRITMQIVDDGSGFDASQAPKGNGLKNMKRRAAQLSAATGLDSASGKGTKVWLEFVG